MAKVTFGILALNAQPFLEYNLRALYPFAHQIIVVEGAAQAAKNLARPDGHSMDGTLEMLQEFKRNHDPEHKLIIVSATDAGYADGFWPEKDEMSQAYAARATGDWLWQVDSDEFYLESDLAGMLSMLDAQPDVSGYSFLYIEFFGGFDSRITGIWHLKQFPRVQRLFRWKPGYRYMSHRPPAVVNEQGQDLTGLRWGGDAILLGQPVVMHHYSYVLPKQAQQKVEYYANVDWSDAFRKNKQWYDEQYMQLKNPLRLGELGGLQWLEPFRGQHPAAIQELQEDLRSGRVTEPMRPTQDIMRLLISPIYQLQTRLAHAFLWLYWPLRVAWKSVRSQIVKF
ncbi:MAG: glycosyltransferase family 2 protein [Anaerolineales bacterium]|nr:glycosyltransferase family 2 protein [Anaerolineales bacterium]